MPVFINIFFSLKDYKETEDPVLYKSEKTNRGPLKEGWMVSKININ